MTIRESLEAVLYQALSSAVQAGALPLEEVPQPARAHLNHVYNEIDNLLCYIRVSKKPGINIRLVVPGISVDNLQNRAETVRLNALFSTDFAISQPCSNVLIAYSLFCP